MGCYSAPRYSFGGGWRQLLQSWWLRKSKSPADASNSLSFAVHFFKSAVGGSRLAHQREMGELQLAMAMATGDATEKEAKGGGSVRVSSTRAEQAQDADEEKPTRFVAVVPTHNNGGEGDMASVVPSPLS